VDTAGGPVPLGELLPAPSTRPPVRPPGARIASRPKRSVERPSGGTHARRGVTDPAKARQRKAADRPGDRWLFAAYATGEVADEQMAALLMAIYFNGLTTGELRAWTGEMVASGERLDLSGCASPR